MTASSHKKTSFCHIKFLFKVRIEKDTIIASTKGKAMKRLLELINADNPIETAIKRPILERYVRCSETRSFKGMNEEEGMIVMTYQKKEKVINLRFDERE